MKYLLLLLVALLTGCAQSIQKGYNDAHRTANKLVYSKDSRTGIYTMTSVPCDGPEKAGLLK